MTEDEFQFLYRWVWVNEWHQPLLDFDKVPYEYLVDLFAARKWTAERNKNQSKKGKRSSVLEQMEQKTLREAGRL